MGSDGFTQFEVLKTGDDVIWVGSYSPDKETTALPVEEKEYSRYGGIAYSWIHNCLGFLEAHPTISALSTKMTDYTTKKEAVSFIEKYAEKREDGKVHEELEKDFPNEITSTIYTLKNEIAYVAQKRIKLTKRFRDSADSFVRSMLLALIAEYEAMVRDTVSYLASENPDMFMSQDSQVKVSEVFAADNIEDFKNRLVEEKIDNILRESHIKQVQIIFDKIGVKLSVDDALIRKFGEICERRNLLTHADGRVNRRYVDNCKRLGISDVEIPEVGSRVYVDSRYFSEAISTVLLMGFFFVQLVWQKVKPNETSLAISMLIDASHEMLTAEKHNLAREICEFALHPKSQANDLNRAYLSVNLALSYFLNPKISGEAEETSIKAALSHREWHMKNSLFSLALDCLQRDYNNIEKRIQAAVHEGLGYEELATWALFAEARKVTKFKEAVRETVGIDLETFDFVSVQPAQT